MKLNLNLDSNTDSSPSTTTSTEDGKRFRTSPRTNAFEQVISLIDAHLGTENIEECDVTEVLATLKGEVSALIGTKLPLEKEEGGRTRAPNGSKCEKGHYIGVNADGSKSYIYLAEAGVIADLKAAHTSVFGPFRTKDGTQYRMSTSLEGCPKLF